MSWFIKSPRIAKTYNVGKAIATIVEVEPGSRKWSREFIGRRTYPDYNEFVVLNAYTVTARKVYEVWLKESFETGIIGVNKEDTIFLPADKIKEITVEYMDYEITK